MNGNKWLKHGCFHIAICELIEVIYIQIYLGIPIVILF